MSDYRQREIDRLTTELHNISDMSLSDIVDALDYDLPIDHRALLRELAYRLYLHAVCVKDID